MPVWFCACNSHLFFGNIAWNLLEALGIFSLLLDVLKEHTIMKKFTLCLTDKANTRSNAQ